MRGLHYADDLTKELISRGVEPQLAILLDPLTAGEDTYVVIGAAREQDDAVAAQNCNVGFRNPAGSGVWAIFQHEITGPISVQAGSSFGVNVRLIRNQTPDTEDFATQLDTRIYARANQQAGSITGVNAPAVKTLTRTQVGEVGAATNTIIKSIRGEVTDGWREWWPPLIVLAPSYELWFCNATLLETLVVSAAWMEVNIPRHP